MQTQTHWQLQIHDPSGEIRTQRLGASALVGRGGEATVLLRDPTTAPEVATIWTAREDTTESSSDTSPFWIKVERSDVAVHLADLRIREAHLPAGAVVRIGESLLVLERARGELALPPSPSGTRPWLTCSERGRQMMWTARKAAATPLSIYLAGETGTGKEVLAHLLHAWSERASGPFVPINCGALPLALAESELFGHVKGAFTGAVSHRPGALVQAHGGTLFLDEIGDLPLDIQVKLLRFLENGEIRPVGADRPSRSEVRLICATHRPLLRLVEEGKFRRDLYYRLASVTIEIPPLRDRPEDVEMLATRFACDLERTLSPGAMLRLKAHTWPGNVRELRHAIERASGLAGPFSPVLGEESFEFLLTLENVTASPDLELRGSILKLEEMERIMVLKALKLSRGNRAAAARILGVARSTLFEMLKRHRITGPRAPEKSVA